MTSCWIGGTSDAGTRTVFVLPRNLNHWGQSQEPRRVAWEHLDGAMADATGWDVVLLEDHSDLRAPGRRQVH